MENETLLKIDINKVVPNPNQPRKEFVVEHLLELRDSIMVYGVIQPIVVIEREEGQYELIAGERRLRASKMAGLTEIPAIVRKETPETDSAVMALIENLQRQDLSFFEEAEGYQKLMDDFQMTQQEVSKKMGKNQSTVANKLRLLKLSPEVKGLIQEKGLTERHARAILKLSSKEDQESILKDVADRDLTVSDTEKLVSMKLRSRMGVAQGTERGPSIRVVSRDIRLILNEINKLVETANKLGIKVTMSKENTGTNVEVKLKIQG